MMNGIIFPLNVFLFKCETYRLCVSMLRDEDYYSHEPMYDAGVRHHGPMYDAGVRHHAAPLRSVR